MSDVVKPNSFKTNLSMVFVGLDAHLRTRVDDVIPEKLNMRLDELVNQLVTRCGRTLSKGETFFRARINPLNIDSPLPCDQMGAPPAHLAREGRLAAAGVPLLYMANDEGTAIAELRPFRSAIVSVVTMTVVDDLRVIDFTRLPDLLDHQNITINFDYIKLVELSELYFSAPAHSSDSMAYKYTQVLIQRLREKHFSAFIYASAQKPGGKNLASFETDVASIAGNVRTFKIEQVTYDYAPSTPRMQLSFPKTGPILPVSPLM